MTHAARNLTIGLRMTLSCFTVMAGTVDSPAYALRIKALQVIGGAAASPISWKSTKGERP